MIVEKNSFLQLVDNIKKINLEFSSSAKRAVNINLTLRNWFIGAYIHEYELNGSDRANYGEKLLSKLAEKLNDLSNCNKRQLYDYLSFYKLYPQIVSTVSAQFQKNIPENIKLSEKMSTVSAQFQKNIPENIKLSEKMSTVSAHLVPPKQIVNKLSYSMIKLLIPIKDEIKRIKIGKIDTGYI
ncbi:MAG: hypothetical protein JW870_18630 [Candidatus Delongbacteria bacterium]|nr:hypothetical protein [Candidatus Delongbacteria bacterium]MBN2795855.1 hypothetical protein [Clostridia bacterium]